MRNLPLGMNRMLLRDQAARRSALQWSESWLHPKSSPRSEAPSNRELGFSSQIRNKQLLHWIRPKILPRRLCLYVKGTFSCKCSSLKRLFACSIERGRESRKRPWVCLSVAAWILYLLAFAFWGLKRNERMTMSVTACTVWDVTGILIYLFRFMGGREELQGESNGSMSGSHQNKNIYNIYNTYNILKYIIIFLHFK